MKLELDCALLVIAVVSIATSAEDIGSQNITAKKRVESTLDFQLICHYILVQNVYIPGTNR